MVLHGYNLAHSPTVLLFYSFSVWFCQCSPWVYFILFSTIVGLNGASQKILLSVWVLFPIWCCLFKLGVVMLSACSSFILGGVLGGGSIDSIYIVGFVWLIYGFSGLWVFNLLLQFSATSFV